MLERIYPTRWVGPRLFKAGESVTLPLLGYEAAIYELRPIAELKEPLLADVVFETGKVEGAAEELTILETGNRPAVLNPARLAALERAGKPLDPAALRSLLRPAGGFARDLGSGVRGNTLIARIAVSPDARSATVGVLLRAGAERRPDPVVSATLDGAAVAPEVVEVKGLWVWYTVPVGPGKHTLRLTVAPNEKGACWSGTAQVWVTGTQATHGVEVRLRGREPIPSRALPATGRGARELPRSVPIFAAQM